MNSLSFLSRQFDHLAAPRAPPSTPVAEYAPGPSGEILPDDDLTLKRVRTWSKPFTVPPHGRAPGDEPPKRSFSSPPGVLFPTLPRKSSRTALASRRPSDDNILRRMFFVRVFMALCNAVRGLWEAITGHPAPRMDDGSDTDEKSDNESDPEARDPLVFRQGSNPPHSNTHLAPPSTPPHVGRSQSEPLTAADEKQSSPTPGTASPSPPTRKTPFHQPKTLVLDLDETLIHSTSRPMTQGSRKGFFGFFGFGRTSKGACHVVEVMLGGRRTVYHVYKRPFVDYFLRKVSTWYTLVIFTASMQEYADPVIDWLDGGRGILDRRLFRESCTQHPNGSYMKDLSLVESDLSRVCLIDNSPICYNLNEANGIPIEGWTHDPSDEGLLDLLPVLDSLRFTGDVRRVLGIRGFS